MAPFVTLRPVRRRVSVSKWPFLLRSAQFCGGDPIGKQDQVFDFSSESAKSLHMGADLEIVSDFIEAVSDPSRQPAITIEDALESHRICFLAG